MPAYCASFLFLRIDKTAHAYDCDTDCQNPYPSLILLFRRGPYGSSRAIALASTASFTDIPAAQATPLTIITVDARMTPPTDIGIVICHCVPIGACREKCGNCNHQQGDGRKNYFSVVFLMFHKSTDGGGRASVFSAWIKILLFVPINI